MMVPTSFQEANRNLTAPDGLSDCGDLPVFAAGNVCISRWRLSWAERFAAFFRGHVWLRVLSGPTQPPVALHTESPFIQLPPFWQRFLRTRTPVLLLLLLVLTLIGCGEQLVAPTPVPTPSPTPTPVPESAATSCVQRNLKLEVQNGAGNPDIIFDFRETIAAVSAPTNRSGNILPASCDYIRVVGWNWSGPTCRQLGDRTGFSTYFLCQEPGDMTIVATHGDFKAIWDGKLIRSRRTGVIELDPLSGKARVFYRGQELQ